MDVYTYRNSPPTVLSASGLAWTIMPFLGHDDRGGQVVPPFVIEVGWQNLLVTFVAMGVIFTAIIIGVILFIRRMSLSRVLRLGDG